MPKRGSNSARRRRLKGKRTQANQADADAIKAATLFEDNGEGGADSADGHIPTNKRGAAPSNGQGASASAAAAADSADGTAEPKPFVNHRGAQAATNKSLGNMRVNARLSEEQLDELRKNATDKVTVTDPETGKERQCDLSNPEDVEFISRTHNMLARSDKESGMPNDLKTGMMALDKNKFPDDLNATGELPLNALALSMLMRDDTNSHTDILFWFPCIPTPVFTPQLFMLLTGKPSYVTIDSFNLFTVYFTCKKILTYSNNTRRNKMMAMAWLQRKLTDRTLKLEELRTFVQHIQFMPSITDSGEAASDVLREAIVGKFEKGAFTTEDAESYDAYIATVTKYEDAETPWADANKVSAEDIQQDLETQGRAVYEDVKQLIDQLPEHCGDLPIAGVSFISTIRLLNIYEMAIMRLLTEASLVGNTIPERMIDDLQTQERIPQRFETAEQVILVSLGTRENLAKARSKAVGYELPDDFTSAQEPVDGARTKDEADAGAGAAVDGRPADFIHPTHTEIEAYKVFINHQPDTEDDVIQAMRTMQDSLHITEPKGIIDGVSITADADTDTDDAGASAGLDDSAAATTTTTPDSAASTVTETQGDGDSTMN